MEEDLQSLGFDSSLMDLVTEVEQMVAYQQANVAPADKQPANDRGLPSKAALLHRYPSTQVDAVRSCSSYQNQPNCKPCAMSDNIIVLVQGRGEEEDFEENDVISLISDQEYSMH